MDKPEQYRTVIRHIAELIRGETDEVAVLSTVVCELHNSFDYFDWTGFYRVTAPGILKVGPYQGTHGCLTIHFERGVCGRCARTGEIQLVPDIRKLDYHIACSSDTLSEIVLPVLDSHGTVRAVLDVDSNTLESFDNTDAEFLRTICSMIAPVYERD